MTAAMILVATDEESAKTTERTNTEAAVTPVIERTDKNGAVPVPRLGGSEAALVAGVARRNLEPSGGTALDRGYDTVAETGAARAPRMAIIATNGTAVAPARVLIAEIEVAIGKETKVTGIGTVVVGAVPAHLQAQPGLLPG
jgi:hypothetical protein